MCIRYAVPWKPAFQLKALFDAAADCSVELMRGCVQVTRESGLNWKAAAEELDGRPPLCHTLVETETPTFIQVFQLLVRLTDDSRRRVKQTPGTRVATTGHS